MKKPLTILVICILALSACLTGCAEDGIDLSDYFSNRDLSGAWSDAQAIDLSGQTAVRITEEGAYLLSGEMQGTVTVSADDKAKVQLVLSGVTITAENNAAIYVEQADKVFLTLAEGSENLIESGSEFSAEAVADNVKGALFSRDDLTINGSGSLTVNSPAGHGIVGKDDLKIKGGTISVTAARKTLSANDTLTVDDGVLTLNAGTEGMEASNVVINGGTISIQAGDDGINATWLSDATRPAIEINGGSLSIVMGAGDTDGIDSNGDLVITGGTGFQRRPRHYRRNRRHHRQLHLRH